MLSSFTNTLTQYLNTDTFSIWLFVVAFLGGLLASVSPCSLGVLPLIIGYVGGYSENDKKKTFIQLVSFVVGLAFVLSVIGALCAITGNIFTSLGGSYWILFLASLILVLGLNLLGIIDLNISPLIKRIPKGNGQSLFLYPFLIGVLFAFAASPCSTPILAGIMGFAALTKNLLISILMLFFFSLGQGIIIILAGVFTSFIKDLRKFAQISEVLMKISGVLLILSAILIYAKVFSKFIQ